MAPLLPCLPPFHWCTHNKSRGAGVRDRSLLQLTSRPRIAGSLALSLLDATSGVLRFIDRRPSQDARTFPEDAAVTRITGFELVLKVRPKGMHYRGTSLT
jgi:hypothetical protein